jgi:hypothetical protein
MSKIFGGKAQKFIEPKAVEAPPPAVEVAAAPVTEVDSGTDADASAATSELRKKFRPSKGMGSTGTGLSV